MGAQFTVPLITVIPGQLIASSLWNGEWNNISVNFIPGGMDSYSDTDSQMQIQTNPFPGSVTSHASSLGGEIERIRYQLAAILGTPFWYQPPSGATPTFANYNANGVFPYYQLSEAGVPQARFAIDANDTYIDFGGAIGRLFFRAGVSGTAIITLNPTYLDMESHRIANVANATTPGDAIPYGQGSVISGSVSNGGSAAAGQIVQGTVSTLDIRPLAITAPLLGAIVGDGLSGGGGAIIQAHPDGVTLDNGGSGNTIQVKANGITSTQIAAGSVTNNAEVSVGSVGFTVLSGGSIQDVPGASVTLTTLGGTIVLITMTGFVLHSSTFQGIEIFRDATVIWSTTANWATPTVPGSVSIWDSPGAGSHTYKVTVKLSIAGGFTGGQLLLSASELRK